MSTAEQVDTKAAALLLKLPYGDRKYVCLLRRFCPDFPQPVGGGNPHLYRVADLEHWARGTDAYSEARVAESKYKAQSRPRSLVDELQRRFIRGEFSPRQLN
jgi:hypothetical protein